MDYILRATAGDLGVRIFIADTTNLCNEAQKYHNTTSVMSAMLGRALTGASIMGAMLKSDSDLITIKADGDGAGGGFLVTSDNKSRVKGYVKNPYVDLPLKANGKLDVSKALGLGELTVIKDLGLKEAYVGKTPLISGEIAEDLTYYFAKSEQIPSSVALGVLVDRDLSIKRAGGFLIQILPDVKDSIIDELEKKLENLKPFTTLLEEGNSLEDILNILFDDVKILDKIETSYYCNCSKEKSEKALISIGESEINAIIEEDEKATVHCHFCNNDYNFNKKNLQDILKKAKK